MNQVTHVPLLDLTRFDQSLEDEYCARFKTFLQSGRYIMGPELDTFEHECAQYCGSQYALGVSSGTDALLLALMALDIGQGDEVICPTYTFFATAGCIWRTGARPVFVDSNLHDCNIDDTKIEAAITDKTKAIIPVHLFGQCANMNAIMTIAQKHNLYVIEDAAQAIGAEMLYQGQIRRAGSVGHFGCFSFFPSKNLGGFGDGGLLTTNESELDHKARIMRVHGGEPKYHHHVIGGNFRLDPLQATLLMPKLQRLDGWSQKRQDNATLYTRLLTQADIAQNIQPTTTLQEIKESRSIFLPVENQQNHIYNQFTLLLPSTEAREHLREKLNLAHIGHEVYYPIPLHKQKCFFDLNIDDANFPIANALAEQTCVIPIFPELYEQEIQYVAQHIIEALKEIFAR